jgi:hypothetical protein
MPDEVTNDTTGTLETKDEFAEAFDVAQGIGDRADLTAADDPANVKEEEPPAVIPPETPPVTPPIETPTPPASEQQPGETDEKYEQRYKTLQGIHKHDKEVWETERTTLLSQLDEAKKPKEVKPPPTPEEETAAAAFVDSLTDEQKEQLAAYEQDFDVVSKMEGIKRGVELAKLRKEMQVWKDEVTSRIAEQQTSLDSRIAPVLKREEENERDTHFSMIREGYALDDGTPVTGHADFEKFRDDGSLLAWIESKPRYLQPALKETYSKGSAMDVIDLLTDFKKDSNITLNLPSSDNVVQMNPNKVAKKQALSAVTTRRGAVSTAGGAPSNDFEGAFDEALNK